MTRKKELMTELGVSADDAVDQDAEQEAPGNVAPPRTGYARAALANLTVGVPLDATFASTTSRSAR